MNHHSSRRARRAVLAAACVGALMAGTAVVASPATAAPTPGGEAEGVIAGAWIVTLKDGQSARGVSAEHARNHGAQVDHVYEHALNGYAARMSDTAAARVQRDSRVASVVADRAVSIAKPTAKPGGGGGGSSPVQTVPTGIKRINALEKVGAATVTVAIIDTGIDATHPDLAAHIDTGLSKNCSSGSSWSDGNGHGSHVAGTVGAINNSQGVVGVAPGVKLAAVRVLNNAGSGSWSSVMCGVDWVTEKNDSIQVANMSLGGSGSEPSGSGCSTGVALHDSICNSVLAGVTYVVAAGNSSVDAAGFVPAAYDEVITVSALADSDGLYNASAAWSASCRSDEEDTFASFSNFGADVDLIAPGVCIHSTWKGGGYNTISGTSMAAPHVAGAAALYKAKVPSATPAQVQSALQSAGTTAWDDRDDPDRPAKEKLLDVGTF